MAATRWLAVFVVAALVLADGAAAGDGAPKNATKAPAPPTKGYYQALQASPAHKMMVQIISMNPTYRALLGATSMPLTVFAPTDTAFNKTAAKYGLTAEDVLKNTGFLQSMLMYHVVPGTPLMSAALKKGKMDLRTMYRGLTISVSNGKDKKTNKPVTWVKGVGSSARVTKWDQLVASPLTGATVGVIHDINGILLYDKDLKAMMATR